MKKYALIESDTRHIIAEFDDYECSLDPDGVKIHPVKPVIVDQQKIDDLTFLVRENYLILTKLLQQYGYDLETG